MDAVNTDKPVMKPAIVLDDVHLSLRANTGMVHILRGINLEVAAGERLAIIGPSGSGKTSLLMVIAALEAATSGRVSVNGHELSGLSEDHSARFRRDNVGIVFQSFHLIAAMTALENVAIPLEFRGASDAFGEARAALAQVGLDHRLDHYPGQLSGGEQQRVAIARALAAKTPVILADEPTGNLDRETGQTIIDLLFDVQKTHNTTLVLVTHDRHIAGDCGHVVEIRDGRIAGPVAVAKAAR